MFKFLTKQFLYGRLYLWLKERIGGILLLAISIFLIFYFHNEYLNYVEYKTKFEESYIGLSFIIKNTLILLIAGGYFYFYFFLNKANKSIKDDKETPKETTKQTTNENNEEMVNSLDDFLEDDELK